MKGRSLAKYIIFGIVALIFIWLAIRFTDLILGWSLYLWFFQKIREVVALPDLITSAIVVWCVAAVLLLGPTVLFSFFIKGKRKAIVIGATVISFGMVSLYLLSLRQADNLFNPYTKESNYVYVKEPDGIIKLYPRGYLVDPLGRETQPLTAEIAQAYRKQQNPPPPPLLPPLPPEPPKGPKPPESGPDLPTPQTGAAIEEAKRQTCLDQLTASSRQLRNASDRFLITPTVDGLPMFICGERVILQPLQTIRIFSPSGQIGGKLLGGGASGVEAIVQLVERPGFVGYVLSAPERVQTPQAPQPSTESQQKITIPRNTPITVRLPGSLSTDKNRSGQEFFAYLTEPLVAKGFVIAERNAEVKGVIVESKKAGRVKGASSLSLKLVQLKAANGTSVNLTTNVLILEGKTSKGSDIAKILGGAAAGTAIGALIGGEKAAARGAIAGAAAGTTTVVATRGKSLELPSETVLRFYLTEPIFLPR